MKPLRLRGTCYGPYDHLGVTFDEGCTAILGEIRGGPAGVTSNGAGKSHILNAIPACLYGTLDEAKFSDLLSNDGAGVELMLELTFEHAEETYRVRRGYSARTKAGKSTLDLEVRVHDTADEETLCWAPLTRESITETQEAIDELLGLSKDTFLASAIMVQDHPSFASKTVGRIHRFQLLSEAMGLDEYDSYRDLARRDRAAADAEILALDGRIRLLEENTADVGELQERRRVAAQAGAYAQNAISAAEHEVADAQAKLAQAREHAAAREAATSKVAGIKGELAACQQTIDRAAAAGSVIEVCRAEIARLEPVASTLASVDTQMREARDAQTRFDAAERDLLAKRGEAARREQEIVRRADEIEAIDAKVAKLRVDATALDTAEHPTCDRCGQDLDAEVRARAKASMEVEAAEHRNRGDELAAWIDTERTAIGVLVEEALTPINITVPSAEELAALEKRRAEAHDADRALAIRRERLTQAEARAGEATDTVKAEQRRLVGALQEAEQSAARFEAAPPPNIAGLDAQAAAADRAAQNARAQLTAATAELARVDQLLEQAAKTTADLDAARTQRLGAHVTRDLAATMEQLYGRDGIPKIIIENVALPYLEAEATRILQRLGLSYEIQLRTERANKTSEGVRAVLDVVVLKENGVEQPYHLFSGGEETRIELGLRIALARLLRNRKGAGIAVLAIDEPKHLDSAGMTALVDLLHELQDEFPVQMLVSHISDLRDAFDQTITVSRNDGRSTIEGSLDDQRVEVAA